MSVRTETAKARRSVGLTPRLLLGAEGLTFAVAAPAAYWVRDASWLVFALLLFAPDLSMLGYLAGTRVGATTYNLAHTLVSPAVLLAAGVVFAVSFAVDVALVWVAHIGIDRLVGYGLKYPTAFGDTHLGRV